MLEESYNGEGDDRLLAVKEDFSGSKVALYW